MKMRSNPLQCNCLRRTSGRRAGRIVQALVVFLVIVAFVVLAAPAMLARRESSRRIMCERRLTEAAQAFQLLDETASGLPGYASPIAVGTEDSAPTSWAFSLFPFLQAIGPDGRPLPEPPYLAKFVRHGPEGPDEFRGRTFDQRVPQLICPSTDMENAPPNRMSFAVNCGQPDSAPGVSDARAHGVFASHWPTPPAEPRNLNWIRDHDGTAFTMLMAETTNEQLWSDHEEPRVGVLWTARLDPQRDWGAGLGRVNEPAADGLTSSERALWTARPASAHLGGANIVFADSRVEFLSQDVDYRVYVNLLNSDHAKSVIEAPAPVPPPEP